MWPTRWASSSTILWPAMSMCSSWATGWSTSSFTRGRRARETKWFWTWQTSTTQTITLDSTWPISRWSSSISFSKMLLMIMKKVSLEHSPSRSSKKSTKTPIWKTKLSCISLSLSLRTILGFLWSTRKMRQQTKRSIIIWWTTTSISVKMLKWMSKRLPHKLLEGQEPPPQPPREKRWWDNRERPNLPSMEWFPNSLRSLRSTKSIQLSPRPT